MVGGQAAGDRVQPSGELPRRVVAVDGLPRPEERFLDNILSIRSARDTSQNEVEQPVFVARDQLGKRGQRLFLGAQRELPAAER